jgi:hypothetical protein
MLRQEVYEKTSEVFGTVVAVANVIGYTSVEDKRTESTPVTYKKLSDEVDINLIICKAIDENKYKDLQKKLYIHNKTRHARAKDLTIYKRAWKEICDY